VIHAAARVAACANGVVNWRFVPARSGPAVETGTTIIKVGG